MGERIEYRDGRWVVPSHPIIPFIEGDGTGPDIWRAARRVFDALVQKVSGGKRQIDWLEVLAGEKAFKQVGNWLPEATLDTIRTHRTRSGSAARSAAWSSFGNSSMDGAGAPAGGASSSVSFSHPHTSTGHGTG